MSEGQLHQIRNVLRLREGEEFAVFDGSGEEWHACLQGSEARLGAPISAPVEPAAHLTLYQALIRPQRFELVLQKGTELGVTRFVPFLAERSVVSGERKERWRSIAIEAAEQSGRRIVPGISQVLTFDQALEEATREGIPFMPWEGVSQPRLSSAHRKTSRLGLIIGPEGGFTEEEAFRARRRGAVHVSLGPRILRAETAAIAATAILLHLNGDV